VLGAAFARAGHRVIAASGAGAVASLSTVKRVAQLLPDAVVSTAAEAARSADVVLVAVPDDVLAAVIGDLARTRAIRAGQVIVHVCGARGLAVLAPAAAVGAQVMAMHPVMTFTGTDVDLDRLAGISYGVTAPDATRPLVEELVAELGGHVEWIAESDRALYHAALSHGANHLVTVISESLDLLRAAGVSEPQRLLSPLVSAAAAHGLRWGDRALTGPVARGDAGTVGRHLAALSRLPQVLAPYRALAVRTVERASAAGLLARGDAQAVLQVLVDQPCAEGDAP